MVTIFPLASSTATWTGAIGVPVTPLEGCCRKTSLAGVRTGPGNDALIAKLVLVADVRLGLVADKVYPAPAALTMRSLKVATPFCGVTVSVPPRPVPPARASVIGLLALVSGFPFASSTTT